jgi:hypothetical protein
MLSVGSRKDGTALPHISRSSSGCPNKLQYSLALTGTYIDAIYHTSIVLNGVEYYFGQGIQTSVPGSTHHGQPMEKLLLGKTELPIDVIEEYIQSLASIYTPEVWHSCTSSH